MCQPVASRVVGIRLPGPESVGGDWVLGRGDHHGGYSIPKFFFPTQRSDGLDCVVWQNQKFPSVHVTWLRVRAYMRVMTDRKSVV